VHINLTQIRFKLLLLCACSLVIPGIIVFSQGTLPPCTRPPTATNSTTGASTVFQNSWPQNAMVTVHIDSGFSPEQQQAVRNGFNNWEGNLMNVTFEFVVDVVPPRGSPPPLNTVYVLADPVNRADITNYQTNGRLTSSYMRLGACTAPANLEGKTAHETGHQFGLANCDNCTPGSSIMGPAYEGPNGDTCNAYYPGGLSGPRSCDIDTVLDTGVYDPPPPTPTPTPTPTPEPTATPSGGECEEYGAGWFPGNHGRTCVPPECSDCYGNGGSYCSQTGACWTPVVIDVNGNGFNLTNAHDGVMFAPDSSSQLLRTAWTAPHSDDAFLVMDRNGNAMIDDGTELFGSASPQPAPPAGQLRQGFRALALYDKPEHGGNNDNQIDAGDPVFAQLELWQDRNHNGVSEAHELQPLSASPVRVIELDYRESRRTDEHGNGFRYRAKVRDARGAQVGRWAWDVFPVSAP